jgi:hypothetical protein
VNQQRKFGLTVGTAFLLLTGILVWRDHATASMVTGGLGGALVLLGVVAPGVLGPVERAWMAMAHAISKVTTPIIMGLVYYLTVAPIGLIMRLFGRQPMRRTLKDGSYWVDRRNNIKSDLQRQF